MKAEMKSQAASRREKLVLEVSFEQAGLRLTETPFGVQVELEDCTVNGQPGGPALPSRILRVALPPFAQVVSVNARAVNIVRLTDKPTLVAPLQLPQAGAGKRPPRPEPDDKPGDIPQPELKKSSLLPVEERFIEPFPTPEFIPPRAELYEQEARKPRPLAALVASEDIGMNPVAVVEVSPVRLVEKGILEFSPEIEVTVTYQLGGRGGGLANLAGDDVNANFQSFMPSIHSRSQAERMVELARLQVFNPGDVFDFSPFFPTLWLQADYLVITDNVSWNAAAISPSGSVGNLVAAFQRLADWKAMRGLKTRVVTVSDIVNGRYGNFTSGARDLQEVLRNFLKWALGAWGISWVLLGGVVNVVPARGVAGASEGHIGVDSTNPPENNKSFWTGTFLRMKVVNPGVWWPGSNSQHRLVRPDTGQVIPYDSAGTSSATQPGWYFTTSDTYATRTSMATQFVRVNGPASLLNATLQWLYQWNTLPTDLYYASLQGASYNQPGKHDWDLVDNGVYGQHTNDADLDGVQYRADVSVGRAPVSSEAQANAFVDKVIAYEQFRRPDGSPLSTTWPRRLLLVSSNWGGRIGIWPTTTNTPGNNNYHHPSAAAHSLIKLENIPADLNWQLIAQVTASDVRLMPFNRNASASVRGWFFAKSNTDLTPSGFNFSIFGTTFFFPIPTNWIAVFGPLAELTPQLYIFDHSDPDGSMVDQEQLRVQIASQLPALQVVNRLYEDEVDLTPAQTAAAPLQHLTEDRLRNALNAAPHWVSLSGHGSSDGCCWLSGGMAANLVNGYHSFIGYADSCLTNQFDAEDAVSEKLLYNPNGGAVGYVGNTRFSWIGVGDNFQRKFFNRLTTTRHFGLLNDVRTSMVNESTGFYRLYNKWAIFTLNLMGDPEMPVWVGTPNQMEVEYPAVLDRRLPFEVRVTRRILFFETPLQNAAVFIRQGNFTRLAFTNASGRAVFDINPAQLGDLDVTVTRNGFIPHIGKARITGPAWVSGTVLAVLHQHGNPHRSLVRLQLSQPISNDPVRGWFARDNRPDYGIILDAATDAYVSEKVISLYVNNTDEGGTIEKFAFGSLYEFNLSIPHDLLASDILVADNLVPIVPPETGPEEPEP